MNPTRDRLILENQERVEVIARIFYRRVYGNVDLEDLIHEGLLGLMDAIDRFNSRMAYSADKKPQLFRAFIDRRIKGAILDYLRRLDPLTRKLRAEVKAGARSFQQVPVDHANQHPDKPFPIAPLDVRTLLTAARLTSRERCIVQRSFLSEQTLATISTEYGYTLRLAQRTRRRAIAKLRAVVSE